MLEQYDTPKEILRNPANDFVKEFVGIERGLKRLALIKVSEIEVEEGPVVSPDDTAERAGDVIEQFGSTWASVVDDGRAAAAGWTPTPSKARPRSARPCREVQRLRDGGKLRCGRRSTR